MQNFLSEILLAFLENLFPQKHSWVYWRPIKLYPLPLQYLAQAPWLFLAIRLKAFGKILLLLSLKHPMYLNLVGLGLGLETGLGLGLGLGRCAFAIL